MSRIAWRIGAVVVIAVLGLGLAAGSAAVQRKVPAVVACEPVPSNPSGRCDTRLLAGGWPFAFLYDNPSISALDSLFLEDDFKPGWFLADAAILSALPAVGLALLRMRRRTTLPVRAEPGQTRAGQAPN